MVALVRINAYERLYDRRGDLKRKRDESDLRKGKSEVRFEHRIDGGQHRLDGVVEKMAEADYEKYRKGRFDVFHAPKVKKRNFIPAAECRKCNRDLPA